jgi:hypothetical protein
MLRDPQLVVMFVAVGVAAAFLVLLVAEGF